MIRFREKSNRVAKRIAIAILIATVVISILPVALCKETECEIAEVQKATVETVGLDVRDSEVPEQELSEIQIMMVFADESEQYPFAGHETTLEQWQDVPEWDIPQEFKDTGGCLPESVRAYLYNLCLEKHLSYPLMLALIEAESSYQWDSSSPDGTCKGYCMISDRWHQDRMERLGVTDIYNPYSNIATSVDYIIELFGKYREVHTVLMCHNCGESSAMELIADGNCSSAYSRKIVEREAEISLEIYGN